MDDLTFLDTNILVYAANEDSPYHARAKEVIQRVNRGKLAACLSSQVLSEFYATVTNPKKVSQPLRPAEAAEAVEGYLTSSIPKLHPDENTVALTLELAKRYQITGLDIFDAQIVATMVQNRIKTLYTANEDDFTGFVEIKTINPLRCESSR